MAPSCFREKGAKSLVEAMVVGAILAILVAILIPVYSNAKRAAKQSHCLSNLGQIGKALILYVSDHDDFIPPYMTEWGQTVQWKEAFLEYKVSSESFFCPLDWRARSPEVEEPYANEADPEHSD
jgi:type II secretory pathway pseudopilin PulG